LLAGKINFIKQDHCV